MTKFTPWDVVTQGLIRLFKNCCLDDLVIPCGGLITPCSILKYCMGRIRQITQVTPEVEKRKLIPSMLGSTWGDNFYMGMQNGSKLEIWPERNLIHTLELKIWHFKVFPYVCIGKPYVCNVLRPRATWGAWPRAHINVMTITQFVQICSMHASRALWTVFFFCFLCQPC